MSVLVHDVHHSYRKFAALHGVDLELTGEPCALVGVNGAGKSTLLTIMAGGLEPNRGTVAVGGSDLYRRKSRNAALARTALMPQRFGYPHAMTALEFVSYLTWMRKVSWKQARERAAAALEAVDLGAVAHVRMGALSGGMVRRVGLAQALAARAEVILLDEPSTGLDPEQRRIMIELVGSLAGVQVLMSSHVMEDVLEVAERVVVLHEGVIVFRGRVAELAALAPADVPPSRAVEEGFLSTIGRLRR
ncbi:ABC transporter ATP-binding protein [Georgenia wangjunii]|uniref:ABC transporter ATP-binding protein n=1 Tax=Georgenia wangjunii TaxID=3117730 RepID=UPI002F26D4E7